MSTEIKNEILHQIKSSESIILHRHVNPDPDALGSQLGLKNILENQFGKKVFAVGEMAQGLAHLGNMDDIDDEIFKNSLCIILDTANEKRVSDQRFKLSPYVIKIDHHPNNEPYGNLSWVDTSFPSTCEMLVDLFLENNKLNVSTQAAELLYTGFIGDTGRFLYPSTTDRTLLYGSYLKKFPFDASTIYNNMYTVSKNTVKAKAHLLNHFATTTKGIGYSRFTKEDLSALSIRFDEASNLVNEMSYIEGVPVWVLFVEDENNYRVRIRSSNTEIHQVARLFNGGGHPLASGATVTENEIPLLLEALNNLF